MNSKYIHTESVLVSVMILFITVALDWGFSTTSHVYEFSVAFYLKVMFAVFLIIPLSSGPKGILTSELEDNGGEPKDSKATFDLFMMYNSLWFLYGDINLAGGTKASVVAMVFLGVLYFTSLIRIYSQFEKQISMNVKYMLLFNFFKTAIYIFGILALYFLFFGKSDVPVIGVFSLF